MIMDKTKVLHITVKFQSSETIVTFFHKLYLFIHTRILFFKMENHDKVFVNRKLVAF